MVPLLAVLLVSLTLVVADWPPNYGNSPDCDTPVMYSDECFWIKTMSTSIDRDFHSYGERIAYSKCVFKHLNQMFVRNNRYKLYLDSHHAHDNRTAQLDYNYLAYPPTMFKKKGKDAKLEVSVEHTELKEIFETWTDARLKFTQFTCFNLQEFLQFDGDDIQKLKDSLIWLPNFHGHDDMGITWTYLKIDGTEGDVYGVAEIWSKMYCNYEFVRYPFDTVRCFYYIAPHYERVNLAPEDPDRLKQDFTWMQKRIKMPNEWKVEQIAERSVKSLQKDGDFYKIETLPQVALSIQMRRSSQLPYTICTMLLATSVTAGMFGPLTGSISGVKFTKLLSIATSVAGVMILALHNPKLYHATVTPHIFLAFEFVLAVSLLSLLVCLTHYHLFGAVTGDLPPPHKVKLVSNLLNWVLFWIPKLSQTAKEEMLESAEVIDNCTIQAKKSYTNEWLEISNCLHRLLFVIFLFVYFIGTIVLCNF